MERTALLFDVHVPYQDKTAYNIAVEYLRNLKPKVNRIVLAGDFADFYQISYFKSDPNRLDFKDEVQLVQFELQELKKKFYRVPIDYLEGNHEFRLFAYTRDNAPKLLFNNNIEDILQLKQRNIRYISNIANLCTGKLPYMLGHLYVLHGHEKKVSLGAINLARLFYYTCHTNVIAGHHHRPDKVLIRKLDGTFQGAWTVGTLGKLQENYSAINSWCHGFAYVDVFDDGDFEVHNKIILNNRVLTF